MSIIYSYPEETSLQGSDMLIGTSTALVGGKQKNITKNFTLDQLSSFIQGGEGVINPAASDFQIAVFNQSGARLTGSIMSQDVYPNGTGITVSGNLSTTGNLVAPGTVTLGSGSNLIDLTSTTKFGGIAQDANGTQGTLNQILLSDTNGRLVWGNYTAGLTYQGLWNASTNSPGLSSSVGVNSTFYIVGTAGNTVLDGNTDWQVGDWAIFVGTTGAGGVWQKIDNTSSITGNGTVNRMVMWSSNFTVTDGPLLDNSGTNVLSILDRSIIPSTSNTRSLGSSSLKWNMLYVNDIETTNINILSHVDLNSLPGTPGQVLTSSGVGAPAVWTTPTTGTITGAGTTNKIPLWTNNVAIGDSILTQLNAATPFTDTYLSVGSGGVSTTGLKVDGFFVDSTGSKGTTGQILSSTGTATLWKTGEDSSVTYSLAAGAQDGSSVSINLTDSLGVITPVKVTGGTNVNVVRTSDTEITLSSTNTTYDFGSSTSGSGVLLNLVGTPADNSSVKLIGSGVTIAQTNDEVTFTVPAGDTYDLNAGAKSGTSVPLNLTSGSGADNSVVNLTEGTGITLTQTSATEITIAGVAQGVTGSGTVNKLPKFDTTTSLTDSLVSETAGAAAMTFEKDGSPNPRFDTYSLNAFNQDLQRVATVDFSSDPFGPGQVMQSFQFGTTDASLMASFRSKYSIPAGTDLGNPGNRDATSFAQNTTFTFTFDNNATITFTQPAGPIAFNTTTATGNNVTLGVFHIPTGPVPGGTYGTQLQYVSGSGSITDGAVLTVVEAQTGGITVAGELDMNTANKIINVAQPTAAQDAATKAYVDNVVTGQLVFQTGYDAANNSPDLTTSPNSILKGWTYAVTNGPSTSFWSPPLNVGDLVVANIDNPTSVADWTEVQSNVGFAGSGATDGATVKGIAGFNSADFDVSNDGWVEAKDFTGTTPGYVPDASTADAGTFLKEDGTWAVAGTGTVTGTGTTNNVAFWSTSTALTSDANLYWDNTNDRLGIGTSIPGYSVDIDSDGNNAIPTIQIQDSLSNMHLRLSSDSISSSSKIESSNDVQFLDGSGNILMNITTVEGRVGIGTPATQYPDSKLHISGQWDTSILTLEGNSQSARTDYRCPTASLNPYASFGTDIGDFTMDLIYYGTQARLFNFNKDGRLGIGPFVVPNYTLDVQEGSSTGNDAVINVQAQDSYNQLQIGAGATLGSTNYIDSNVALQIKRSSNSVMSIDYDTMAFEPRVGINTTNPNVSFEIATQDAIKIPVGSNIDRSYITASNGMLRYNSDALEFEGYSDGAWGAIGGGGASATITTQNAVGDGTNLTFALGATPNGGSSSFVDVFIDGVYQEISTYSISGTNLVFDAGNAPAAGTNVETKTTADYNVGAAVQTVNGASGNVSTKDIPVVKTNSTPEAVTTQNQHLYVLYGSAAVTLTLPSSPAAGDYIKISNLSTLTTNVVAQAASGERIMGTAANLTLDNATASFQLIYSGVSDPGWVVVGPA